MALRPIGDPFVRPHWTGGFCVRPANPCIRYDVVKGLGARPTTKFLMAPGPRLEPLAALPATPDGVTELAPDLVPLSICAMPDPASDRAIHLPPMLLDERLATLPADRSRPPRMHCVVERHLASEITENLPLRMLGIEGLATAPTGLADAFEAQRLDEHLLIRVAPALDRAKYPLWIAIVRKALLAVLA